MSMILCIEYDVDSCKDCPLLGRDGVNYACRLIASKHLDFHMLDQRRDEECPLVHVESRLKGKWKHHKTKSNKQWYECDSCGWVHFQKSNYCPNCGAGMEDE